MPKISSIGGRHKSLEDEEHSIKEKDTFKNERPLRRTQSSCRCGRAANAMRLAGREKRLKPKSNPVSFRWT
jgi:hypothetical protein